MQRLWKGTGFLHLPYMHFKPQEQADLGKLQVSPSLLSLLGSEIISKMTTFIMEKATLNFFNTNRKHIL